MGIGVGLALAAIGAILAFAVHTHVNGLDLQTVGVILMVVGGLGALLAALFWSSFSPYRHRETVVYHDRRDVL